MEGWHGFTNILMLLAAALLLGSLAEQLKQSAMVGYIIAGLLVGPHAFGWVGTIDEVEIITELGAALLLFTIGLEFSFKKLARLGAVTVALGIAQILLTGAAVAIIAMWLGLNEKAAVITGAAIALSSTASVLRIFTDKAMTDSIFGRYATGTLLLQDIAVVPLVLVVTSLTGGKTGAGAMLLELGKAAGMSVLLFLAMLVFLNHLVPRMLNLKTWQKNRELPVLLSVVIAAGSALAAHSAGISPAFGAFFAGMLLAESPFAVQIRADVSAIRAILVTLFFASIGMLSDPVWMLRHFWLVAGAALAIIFLKTFITAGIMMALKFRPGIALATGICIAQAGEFSFVITSIALPSGIIGGEVFKLIISATIVTLLATPYLVGAAPFLARMVEPSKTRGRNRGKKKAAGQPGVCPADSPRPVVVIGFGPAGQKVVELLLDDYGDRLVVLDFNPKNAVAAKAYGVEFHVGDARHADVLEHVDLKCAAAIVVTLPDSDAARQIILHSREFAPDTPTIVRGRYNIFLGELNNAGATVVISEEDNVGIRIAEETRKLIE